ncbi:MAG: hypothetical protein WBO68_13480 [Pyrinomonadaceae bacterium]
MGNIEKINNTDERFQALLGSFLRGRSSNEATVSHLDQDTLSAFAEGNITEREAAPVVSHLADCNYCRHITSELVRLDLAFAENDNSALLVSDRAPAKVSEVLSGILSRIFGSADSAVFAHQEPDNDEEASEDEMKDDK